MAEQGNIFKAYDIRGVYGDELDEGIAYLIGRAIATFIPAKEILVGEDMRVSSKPLKEALIAGITDQGADVVEFGLCSTPMFYFATQTYQAGVMVTASHNPAKYNGFKICRDGTVPVGAPNGMDEIKRLVLEQDFPSADRKGTRRVINVVDEFIAFNLSFLKTDKKFKIVIDAGNGMGGYTYSELKKRIPHNIEIIPMYFELDGNFPNHEANPLKFETLKALQAKIKEVGADLGVATDGDEDRVFFVDNEGVIVPSDVTHAILAKQVLEEHPGSLILYTVNESRIVPESIAAAGGKSLMGRIGHAYEKIAMREHNAIFAGELSGHFFNAEQTFSENTQIVFFRMLNILAELNVTLADLARPLRTRYAKIEETNFETHNAAQIIDALDSEYSNNAQSVSRIDGLRVDFADWWFNVRLSNTEPLLRLNLEATTPALMHEKFEELKRKIEHN